MAFKGTSLLKVCLIQEAIIFSTGERRDHNSNLVVGDFVFKCSVYFVFKCSVYFVFKCSVYFVFKCSVYFLFKLQSSCISDGVLQLAEQLTTASLTLFFRQLQNTAFINLCPIQKEEGESVVQSK